MYINHDITKVSRGGRDLYLCHTCNRYMTEDFIKEHGWKFTKRTRMGRKKLPKLAHQVIASFLPARGRYP